MGYQTEFTGHVRVRPKLSASEIDYLIRFSESRRMLRRNGPYYIGGGLFGQDTEPDIIDYNDPALGQPGLWCKWAPTESGASIKWNGYEKFYDSAEWMLYLIQHFLRPLPLAFGKVPEIRGGHMVNGTIHAQGETEGDVWDLIVEDNIVYVKERGLEPYRVVPSPYKFDLHYEPVRAYFKELFKELPPISEELFVRTTAYIDVNPDTGLPTDIIRIVNEHGPRAQAPFAMFQVTPNGLVPLPIGPLDWIPPEE
jgi:hypothetical protein